jgi:hypothetical protein
LNIALSYDWNPAEFRRAALAVDHRSRMAQWVVAVACILLAGRVFQQVMDGVDSAANGGGFLFWLFLSVGLALILTLTVRSRRSVQAQAVRLCVPTQAVLTDADIKIERTNWRGDVNWTSVRRIRQTKEFFLLYVGKKRAIPIPKRAFAPAQLAEFTAFIDARALAKG